MESLVQPGLMYASDTGAVFTLSDSYRFSEPQIKDELTTTAWAPWGANNLKPIEMAEKIDKCGVLNSGIEAKARIAIGKGIRPVFINGIDKDGNEEIEFVNDPEIDDWLEINKCYKNSINSIRNTLGYGFTHDRFILDNTGKKIALWKTDDVVSCRLERRDPATGHIENSYISADWKKTMWGDADGTFIKKIRLLREDYEYYDLKDHIDLNSSVKEFGIISRGHLNGKQYYPNPLWYSANDWVDMAIKVPAMKVAMMNNQMSIKYIITISEQYFKQSDDKWDGYTSEQKQEKFIVKSQEINNHLVGNDKAYKSITTTSWIDPRTNVEVDLIRIQVLDDKVKDGKLLPDSGAANKEILFALMMNPAINGANTFGGDYSGGAGSGSDIREAFLVQLMLMEAERQMISYIMNIVKRINGWADKYPGKNLQFRFPNLVLTTLDKGGSTAPVNP